MAVSCGSHNTFQWFGQTEHVINGEYNVNKACLWDVYIDSNCKFDYMHNHNKEMSTGSGAKYLSAMSIGAAVLVASSLF